MRLRPLAWIATWLVAAPLVAARLPLETFLEADLRERLHSLTWSRDGKTLVALWREGEPKALRAFDAETGAERWSFSFDRLPGIDVDRPFFVRSFDLSPVDDTVVMVAGGDLYLLLPASGEARRLTDTDAEEKAPRYSPDGRRIAFVRDADLWLVDVQSGAETRLTTDGRPGEILNGEPDWVYAEEIWNRKPHAFWWSPTGQAIAYVRFDERDVPRHPLVDDRSPRATVDWQRYPQPGDPNPRVTLHVVELLSGTTEPIDTGTADGDSYLARVHWRLDGSALAVERLDRDQSRLELLVCRLRGGDCRAIVEQQRPTWVDLSDDFRFLSDGSFLWSDDGPDGRRLLARYDHLGRRRLDLMPAGWSLDQVLEVVESRGEVLVRAFRTAGLGAAERSVLALHLGGRRAERVLTPTAGWHTATVAAESGYWVHEASDSSTPPTLTIRLPEGTAIVELPAPVAWSPEFDALPRWRTFTLPGPGGVELPARLLRPDTPTDRRVPVVMYQYGGPASQVVRNGWGGERDLWHRWLASRGYAVLAVDNPASRFFAKSGAERLHRRFGEIELAAQLAAVAWLRSQPWVDSSRLGLWGWSGGGSNALYAVTHAPGVWRATVAGAPVTDWRLYDSIWTERYLDHPTSNPDGYRDSSALSAAARLADPLLVVHGTGDDNVHSQNTTAFVAALIDAGKPVETAIYPGQLHRFSRPASAHFYARMTAFFDRHLLPATAGPEE